MHRGRYRSSLRRQKALGEILPPHRWCQILQVRKEWKISARWQKSVLDRVSSAYAITINHWKTQMTRDSLILRKDQLWFEIVYITYAHVPTHPFLYPSLYSFTCFNCRHYFSFDHAALLIIRFQCVSQVTTLTYTSFFFVHSHCNENVQVDHTHPEEPPLPRIFKFLLRLSPSIFINGKSVTVTFH